jgi:KDO2-lipid IV(A) lauroyltransferase
MTPGRRVRYRAEYLLARSGLALMDGLSLGSATRFAVSLGRIWFAVHGSRRRLAVSNILGAGLATDHREAVSIARASFSHFALTLVEALKLREVVPPDRWRDRVEWVAPPETDELLGTPGKGAILLTGHVGSWVVAGYAISRMKTVNGIARPPNNPHTNRIMQERLLFDGLNLMPKHDANPLRLLAVPKRGEILALLFDQFAVGQSVNINFFGRPAATYASAALLHLVGGAPIVFGSCIRTEPQRFRLELSEPLRYPRTGDRDADVRNALTDLTARLESVVRAHPEQYLWAHRRWRVVG